MCCSPWGHKESDTTERLNNNSPCPPSWTFPSGSFRLNCMKLSTVNHFVPRNSSVMWFNSVLLCWPLDSPSRVGTEEELAQEQQKGCPIWAAVTPPPRLAFSLPLLTPEAVSPTFSLHQLFPLNTQSSSLTISTCHFQKRPQSRSTLSPEFQPCVSAAGETSTCLTEGERMGRLCPPVMPSPNPGTRVGTEVWVDLYTLSHC